MINKIETHKHGKNGLDSKTQHIMETDFFVAFVKWFCATNCKASQRTKNGKPKMMGQKKSESAENLWAPLTPSPKTATPLQSANGKKHA